MRPRRVSPAVFRDEPTARPLRSPILAGKRQIGLVYLDAMLEAMDLTVGPR